MFVDHPTWAYGLWIIAGVWLAVFFWHLRRRVDIDVVSCDIKPTSSKYIVSITIMGFIYSRHPDGVIDIQLGLYKNEIPHSGELSIQTVEPITKKFEIDFNIPFDRLGNGRNMQQKGSARDFAVLYVITQHDIWESPAFTIPKGIESRRSRRGGMRIKDKIISPTKRRGEPGMTKEQFHELLKKAAQPEKKQPPDVEKP